MTLLPPLADARAAPTRPSAEVWKDPNCGCVRDATPAVVAGYALAGDVPARDINRLLQGRPVGIGLAVPGMDGPEYGNSKDAYSVLLLK